jgi:glycosyltransferase involved in cell wall biosynthesis
VIFLLFAAIASLIGMQIFSGRLRRSQSKAVQLRTLAPSTNHLPTVSVIIPAYNEAANLQACVTAVLESSDLPAEMLEVWVVDDQSTDQTLAIAHSLQASLADSRLHILAGEPRPAHETWMGKNWACAQVVPQTKGDFLLFVDADVRLRRGAIETALYTAEKEQVDLLTFWMTIVCGCFAEWLAQPIITSLFSVGFDFEEVNDPQSETAFAVGPFMLFRRSAYEQIGGHGAVAGEIVEDVALGRRIKKNGLKIWYGLGHDLASVQMYRSTAALWEGWTKNWYVGVDRNLQTILYIAFVSFLVFSVPWLAGTIALAKILLLPFNWLDLSTLFLALAAIAWQYNLYCLSQKFSNISPRYWWLAGIGGIFVSAIAIVSIIKTETGWGWTWRGRSLRDGGREMRDEG